MQAARNLKRTIVAFSFEVTCLFVAYLAHLLWNGNSITGSLLTDMLLLGFLSTLFALDYAIVSRRSSGEVEEGEVPDQVPALNEKGTGPQVPESTWPPDFWPASLTLGD